MNNQESLATVKDWIEAANKERRECSTAWNDSLRIFLGAHQVAMKFNGNTFYPVVNQTAAIIELKHAVLNSAPIVPLLVPGDNNEPAEYYLTKMGADKVSVNPDFTGGMVMGSEPVDPVLAKALIDGGMFTDEDVFTLDDAAASSLLTKEIQHEWRAENGDEFLAANNKRKLIIGHADVLVQWDAVNMRVSYKQLAPGEVWVCPGSDSVSRADWVVVRHFITKEEAALKYPRLKENNSINVSFYSEGMACTGNAFEKSKTHVEIVNAFQRYHKVGDKIGIRQIQIVGGQVAFDGMSAFRDIPVCRNLHYLRPFTSYGIGEPQMLMDLQDLKNRIWGMIFDRTKLQNAPVRIMPSSAYEAMKAENKHTGRAPNTTLSVDDELFAQLQGRVVTEIPVQQVEDALRMLVQDITAEIDRLAGTTNAVRGELLAGSSGVAVQHATTNAQGTIHQSARQTEIFLSQIFRQAANLILDNLPAEEMYKRNRRWPLPVIEKLKERAKKLDYDMQVQVSAGDADAAEFDRLTRAAQTAQDLWTVPEFVQEVFKRLNVRNGESIGKAIADRLQQQLDAKNQPQQQPQPEPQAQQPGQEEISGIPPEAFDIEEALT